MVISKNSWHYQLQCIIFQDYNIPHNLCLYVWKTILAGILFIVLTPLFIALLPLAGIAYGLLELNIYTLKHSKSYQRLYWIICFCFSLMVFEIIFYFVFSSMKTTISPQTAVGLSLIISVLYSIIPVMAFFCVFWGQLLSLKWKINHWVLGSLQTKQIKYVRKLLLNKVK